MIDFTILHLSDLHINFKGAKLPLLLENLLEDIKAEMSHSQHIVVVVTGDLIHKGNYDYKSGVKVFFTKLKEVLDGKVEHIYIVPGNHDKNRNILDKKMVKMYKNGKNFYPNGWKYLRMGFDEYTELVEEIYAIFYGEEGKKRGLKDTFGVYVDEINGKNICFILFNSAWSSLGDKDIRKLRIGKFQLDKIKESYEACTNNVNGKIELTIAIAHHPIDWLNGFEEDLVRTELLSNNGLNANIYICGHIHNRDVFNWQNNRHSLTTLVSGIGWPEGSEGHPYPHTYSSYVFNLDVNSIDVYVRSSNDDYCFEPDFRIYTAERNKEYNKIVMPINICRNQSYFNLGTALGRSPKGCYITDNIIRNLNKYVLAFARINQIVYKRLELLKVDEYESNFKKDGKENNKLYDFWFKAIGDIEYEDDIITCLEENQNRILTAYLQSICTAVYNTIADIKPDTDLRVHFRYWNWKDDKYYQLSIAGTDFKNYVMEPFDWGELLEATFVAKRPLIASVNQDCCAESLKKNETKSEEEGESVRKWTDFMTFIPQFSKNYFVEKNKQTEKIEKERPLITGGITVYSEEDRDILYLLDYLRIDEQIGDMMKNFLYFFPFNISDCIKNDKENDDGSSRA